MSALPSPLREVLHADALVWLAEHPATPGASLLTSLPDKAELGLPLDRWRPLFQQAACLCLQAVDDEGLAVFFQTDNREQGRWVSKAGLVLAAAAELGIPLVWHKIVLRRPAGSRSMGRPGYSHLLAFSAQATVPAEASSPDVLPELGEMPWSHGMGLAAAEEALRTIRRASPSTRLLLAPFCGHGTALEVANRHGLDTIGIERNRKRAERARGNGAPL